MNCFFYTTKKFFFKTIQVQNILVDSCLSMLIGPKWSQPTTDGEYLEQSKSTLGYAEDIQPFVILP